jgi:tRNA A-37 threonylcarbamoyl transferase component Bud32
VSADPDAVGSDHRFEMGGRLGEGGMGVVYRAHDRQLGRDVALKILRHASGRDLYRFKREFRLLADIAHPNLVALHELHTAGDQWFVTMELVEGVPFLAWVRPAVDPTADPDAELEGPTATVQIPRAGARSSLLAPLDARRLSAALAQLADGVLALHASGKLHRDLKPSNVLVRGDGVVKLLDFGLIAEVESIVAERTHEQAAVGTPAYMSPEQAADQPLSEASDWYSVGVMLYEGLTGRRPFEGPIGEIMRRKQDEVPLSPLAIDDDVPPALAELALRLLERDPARRAGGRDILDVLGKEPSPSTRELEQAVAPTPFVGREAEQAVLADAFRDAHDRCVAVFVRGPSGIGKSQLIRRFLDDDCREVLVLEGRCYERESVPFKGLDTVIDALAGVLRRLPDDDVRRVLPPGIATLQRLFPVLRRVPVIAEASVAALFPPDPQELRSRAFGALRQLLRVLGPAPVVIAIDDLQWGDADSARFLAELIHPDAAEGGEPLRVLLVLAHRSDDELGIAARVRTPPAALPAGDVRTIELAPLADGEARALVASVAGEVAFADALVRDAAGNPLLLVELARSTQAHAAAPLRLDEMFAQRIAARSPAARDILRTAAVAARPIPIRQLMAACDLTTIDTELAELRVERLARERRSDGGAAHLELSHDRIRGAVLATMTAGEIRDRHEALAHALEAGDGTLELDALVVHWQAAGQPERAAAYALRAADAAAEAMAFHRAAALYGIAADHADGEQRRRLLRRRGESLASAGQLDEAAAVFAAAIGDAAPDEALDLQRLRIEQLLRRGHLDDGLALADQALASVGLNLPTSRAAAVRGAVLERVRLRLRGLDFEARPEASIAPASLRKIDLLFATASGLSTLDPVLGKLLQFRFLREALDVGEPRRIAIAMCYEVGYLALAGIGRQRQIDRLLRTLEGVVAEVGDPAILALADVARGLASFLLGNWAAARAQLHAGWSTLRDRGVGMRWELNVAERFLMASLFYLGETRELVRQTPLLLREAGRRGDTYAQHGLRGWRNNVVWLVQGRVEEARAHAEAVAADSPSGVAVHLHHYYDLLAQTQIELYEGDAPAAWRRLNGAWPALERSQLLRLQSVRIEAMFLRGRTALARLRTAGGDKADRLSKVVAAAARQLGREKVAWASAFARHLGAELELGRGHGPGRLEAAENAYRACDMALYGDAVRLRRASVDRGIDAVPAQAAMRAQAVVDPAAMARLLAP